MHDPNGPRPLLWARASAVVLALVLTPPPAVAQEPAGEPGVFREQVEVELVTVDVWVTDERGEPVPGLDASRFKVLHDGEPVPIAYFSEVRDGVVLAAPASPASETGTEAEPAAPAAEPGHLVVYIDGSRLHPSHLRPLVTAMDELLAAGTIEPERILVLRQSRRLSVAVPFGSTEAQVREALAQASGDAAGAELENETRLALEAIRTAWEQAQDAEGSGAAGLALVPDTPNPVGQPTGGGSPRSVVGGVGGGGGPDACGMFVNQVRPTVDAWTRSRRLRLGTTLSHLSDSVGFLAGLPGVKTLLYVSDGLDSRPGTALATYVNSLCPAAGVEMLGDASEEDATRLLLEFTRHANANRVTIHAVEASGLSSPSTASAVAERGARGGGGQRASSGFDAANRASRRDGLELIARETGGRTVFNRNELGPEIARISDASRSYYSLAYEPPPGTGEGRSHRIEVDLDDRALVASYRRGYVEKEPEQWLGERVEGALNLGITSNPLDVKLGLGGTQAAEEGRVKMQLHVIVPAERLTFLPREGGEWVAEISVKILARAMETDALALRDQTFRVKGAPGAAGPVGLPVELELDPGAHLTAVGVRDDSSRQASFISTLVDASLQQ